MTAYHYEPCECKTNTGVCSAMNRRSFLKRTFAAGMAGGLLLEPWAHASIEALYEAGRAGDAKAVEEALAAWTRDLHKLGSRRFYYKEELEHIAFPLGGIGAGQVYLCGDGRLWSWQICNNFQSGHEVEGAFFAVSAKTAAGAPVSRLLRRDPDNPDCVADAVWSGEYPLAWIDYADDALPVAVRLKAYSPFVPLDMKDSGLPAAVFTFTLNNKTKETVEASLLSSMPNLIGWDGYAALKNGGLSGPEFMGNENRVEKNRLSFLSQSGTLPALDKATRLMTQDGDVSYLSRLCKNLSMDLDLNHKTDAPQETVYWFGTGGALPPDDSWARALDAVEAGAGLVIVENGDGLLSVLGNTDESTPNHEVFEDFESGNYANWTLEGTCFGEAPAKGTLPGQQPVTGYKGEHLVNTFLHGDDTTGRAVSKPFTIKHRYVHLLVGGGDFPGETCVNFKIGDAVIHTANGRNEERLKPVVWNVADHLGKEAVIEIVDNRKGGWGHINVDHIVFSDSLASPLADPKIKGRIREALPFRFSSIKPQDAPADIHADGPVQLLQDLPEVYRKAGRRCIFETFEPGEATVVLAKTADGTPVIVCGAYGKGRIVICNGLALDAMPGPVRRNVYGGLIALARDAAYTPQTGWPEEGIHSGTMSLCVLAEDAAAISAMPQWDNFDALWSAFQQNGLLNAADAPEGPAGAGRTWNGAIASTVTLPPGAEKQISFVLTWHFPNRMRNHRYIGGPAYPQYDHRLGNMYNNWFKNAEEVTDYVCGNFDRLQEETHAFHSAFYSTTLPRYLLDTITANLAIIRSPLYMWLEDGTVAGFEGTDSCCPMNCTHVYNYAMTPAYLFPAMERNVRETDLLVQMHPTEHYIPHRTVLPLSQPRLGFEIGGPHHPALDGEFGTLLKTLREYRQCGDDAWLQHLWPQVKQHILYLMKTHDPDGSGVIKGEQPNTYDIHTYGSNTFIGTLYLGALRAVEEMALAMKEDALARQCRERLEKGMAGYDETCWNGAFYYNVYDAPDATPETYNKGNCWGAGCHADHLLGQWWANLLDLGYLLPKERVRSALESIYRYCWRGRLDLPEHKQRIFADPWERGLLNCAWPEGGRPDHPVFYCDEVWTGIEYEVAALFMHEGMVVQALQVVKAARDRYTGNQRNPYSEIECGAHYARAMSSWSLLPAAAGFQYHAGKQHVAFAPRFQPEAFTAFFTTRNGYGLLTQQRNGQTQTNSIEMKRGSLQLKTLCIELTDSKTPKITLNPAQQHQISMDENRCTITFDNTLDLKPDTALKIIFSES